MGLPTVLLYLVFPLNDTYLQALKKVDPSLRALFVNHSDEYLQEITIQGKSYLGKPIGQKATLSQLKLLEVNIYSLLSKLFPHHSCKGVSLKLIAKTD